jgi:hypothetical protein
VPYSNFEKEDKELANTIKHYLIVHILSKINGNSRFDNINNNNKIIAKLPTTTIIKIISFVVIFIGTAIALFGWIFGYLEVTSIIHEGGTMKFVTSIFLFFLDLLFILYVILL